MDPSNNNTKKRRGRKPKIVKDDMMEIVDDSCTSTEVVEVSDISMEELRLQHIENIKDTLNNHLQPVIPTVEITNEEVKPLIVPTEANIENIDDFIGIINIVNASNKPDTCKNLLFVSSIIGFGVLCYFGYKKYFKK